MTAFRSLDQADVAGKRVLLRVDLNAPMLDGKVSDVTRIERMGPTITEIADKGGKVILLSHFGRPKGPDPKESLRPVAAEVARIIKRPVAFVEDCIGEKAEAAVNAMKPGDILCLENTRFHKGEEKNDPEFAAALAKPRRHLGQRRLLGGASRARLDRRARPSSSRLCRAQHAGRARRAAKGAGDPAAAGGRHRRRRQNLDQARTARQPHRQGRCADHRRRHGQHVPGRAGQGRRQVAVRARNGRHRPRDSRQGGSQALRDRAAGRRGGGAEIRRPCAVAGGRCG